MLQLRLSPVYRTRCSSAHHRLVYNDWAAEKIHSNWWLWRPTASIVPLPPWHRSSSSASSIFFCSLFRRHLCSSSDCLSYTIIYGRRQCISSCSSQSLEQTSGNGTASQPLTGFRLQLKAVLFWISNPMISELQTARHFWNRSINIIINNKNQTNLVATCTTIIQLQFNCYYQ